MTPAQQEEFIEEYYFLLNQYKKVEFIIMAFDIQDDECWELLEDIVDMLADSAVKLGLYDDDEDDDDDDDDDEYYD